MDPLKFFAVSRLVIVAGKGGVGKTTVTAVLARAAARSGLRVLVIDVEGRPGLGELCGAEPGSVIGYEEQTLLAAGVDDGAVGGEICGRTITAGRALGDYLDGHGFGRITRRLARGGVFDVVATAAPGIEDILVLGKVKQLERAAEHDLIILDGPAAGHAIPFLQAAAALLETVDGGPIRTQAADVAELLADPRRCQVLLVALAEETPVNELIDTSFALEDRVGVALTPVVVNAVLPPIEGLAEHLDRLPAGALADAAAFRLHRCRAEHEQLDRLAAALPLPQLIVPFAPAGELTGATIDALVDAFVEQIESSAVSGLAELVERAAVIVCAGPGGVGKTTTSAAIALEAARRGRRVVVVTVDPAKRLADALGLTEGLSNDPAQIELPPSDRASGPGEMWAAMLDTRDTFDAVVRRHAPSAEQAERIVANRFYRNIAGALPGTQEYMAAEKLYELHGDDRFDLVVVDTPPTRQALDFLDASERLTRFLDHRLYQALTLPTKIGLRVVNVAAQAFVRTVSKVVGGAVIAEAIEFFQVFDGMEAGFRERSRAVTGLLRTDATRYVLVTTARREAVAEAGWFAGKLVEHGTSVAAVIVNRRQPTFGATPVEELRDRAAGSVAAGEPEAGAWVNLAELAGIAAAEAEALRPLLELTGGEAGAAPVEVPLLVTDVHDLDGLAVIAGHLFAGRPAGG